MASNQIHKLNRSVAQPRPMIMLTISSSMA